MHDSSQSVFKNTKKKRKKPISLDSNKSLLNLLNLSSSVITWSNGSMGRDLASIDALLLFIFHLSQPAQTK